MADRVRVEIVGDSSSLVAASNRAERAIRGVGTETRSQTKAATAFNAAGQKQAKTTGIMGSSAVVAAKSWAKFGAAAAAASAAGAAIRKIASDTMDFDAAMRNVNSIAQLSEKRFASLENQVLDLAGPTAQMPKTLAEGMYTLVSSGFKANEALTILSSSAKAATAGLTDTATATTAVSAVLNAYHLSAKNAGHVSDLLFQTVNRGVITFGDLSSQIGDVLPNAAPLGIGLDQVGAAIATMTKEGIPSAEAVTKLKQAIVAFIKPTDTMKATLKELGFESGAQIVQQKGFEGALLAVTKQVGGSQQAIAKLFPDVRGLTGALALTGKNAKAAGVDLQYMAAVGGVGAKALEQQSQSISYQWNKLKAEASVLSIRVGFAFIKVVKDIAHAKGQIGKSVHDIGVFLGPIIGGILDGVKRMFQGMFKSISSTMKLIGDLLHGRWSKIWADIRGIFQGFFRWLGGVGKLMLTPLIAAAKLVDNGLTNAFGGMWSGIKGVFVDGANAVISVMNSLLDILDKVPFVDVGNIGALGGGGPPKGSTRHPKPGRGPHFADGGLIDGTGLRDTVPIMAAPGEAILNRHQQAPVETALRSTYGFGLGELFRRESTPHYMATGGFADIPHFDIGGFIGNAIDTVTGAGKRVLQNTVGVGLGEGGKWLAGQIGTAPSPFGPFPMWAATKASNWLTGEAKAYGKKHPGSRLSFSGSGGLDFALGPETVPPIQFAADHAGANSHVHISGTSIPWVIAVGHAMQKLGYQVGEFAAKTGNPFNFGPITTSAHAHYPHDHYSGYAIDVNTAADETHAEVVKMAKLIGGGKARGGFVGGVQRFAGGGHVHSGFINKVFPATAGSVNPLPGFQIARLAEHFGMPGRTMEQITRGESGGDPGALEGGSGPGLGLWQITPPWNADLIRKYGGSKQMRNPIQNAKAARDIARRQGIASAWVAEASSYNAHYDGAYTDDDLIHDMGGGGDEGGGGKPKDTGPTKAEIATRKRKRRANARVKQRAETLKGLRQNLGLGLEGASKAPQLTALARFWHLFGDFADKKPRWTALEKRLDNARTEKARLMTLREMRRVTRGFDEANISGHSTEALKEERGPLPGYDTPLDRKQMKAEREKKLRGLRYRVANADNPKRKLAAFEALRDFWATYGVFGDTFKPHAAGGGVGPGRSHDTGATVQHYKRAAYDPKLTGAKHLAAVKKWDTWAARHGEISGAPEDKLKGRIPRFGKDKGPNWEEIARLRGELLLQAKQALLASQAEFGVFKGLPGALGGPFLGSFARGTAGRRIGRDGLIYVHRDEVVQPDPEGPAGRLDRRPPATAGGGATVNLYVDSDIGPMVGKIRAEIDGRAAKVVDKQLGRRQRQFAVAPGRA